MTGRYPYLRYPHGRQLLNILDSSPRFVPPETTEAQHHYTYLDTQIHTVGTILEQYIPSEHGYTVVCLYLVTNVVYPNTPVPTVDTHEAMYPHRYPQVTILCPPPPLRPNENIYEHYGVPVLRVPQRVLTTLRDPAIRYFRYGRGAFPNGNYF